MESITPISTYISQSAKKRVFTGGTSSSRCKEVICHEIIDVDVGDDRGNGLLNNIGDVERDGKGKEALSSFPPDHGNLANNGSGNDVHLPDNRTVEDSNSNLFYGEEEWIDTYYDDIVFDDYEVLQSHYDRMDIPPGVEMPFPWLPGCLRKEIIPPVPSVSTSSNSQKNSNGSPVPSVSTSSNSQKNSNGAKPSTDLSSSSPLAGKKSVRLSKFFKPLSSQRATPSVLQHLDGKPSTSPLESGLKKFTSLSSIVYQNTESSPVGSSDQKVVKGPFELGKTKKRFMGSHTDSATHFCPPGAHNFHVPIFHSGPLPPHPVLHGGFLTSSSQAKSPGVSTHKTGWEKDMPMNIFEPSTTSLHMNESANFPKQHASTEHQNDENPTRLDQKSLDEILQNFDSFKKFDTVEDCSDHHYYRGSSIIKAQPRNNWAKRIQEEWKILENDLPDKIFVRVYESRMDLLRAVIVGAEGTPYHDGLFFFDICFPIDYPNSPPHVLYRSGGLRINPNLYNCGKVCLSLLNTWGGNNKEKWIPGVSTMLQVLVSIQGLILNSKPFFNEPGFSDLFGSESGEKQSVEYNERTFIYSVQTMVYTMRRPPKYFEDFVIGHFCKCAIEILVACQAYLDGAQVGSLAQGGVQDVNNESCSLNFKTNLAGYITTLVNAFSKIGAKDCDQFLCLAQEGNGNATAVFPADLYD